MVTAAIWLDVDARSGVPIYVQIVGQVRHAVEVGSLASGDRLPTVRALAGELTVAPNTVVKAYNELQRAGLIESRAGVGTIVSEGVGITEDELWERFEAAFERVHERNASREEK